MKDESRIARMIKLIDRAVQAESVIRARKWITRHMSGMPRLVFGFDTFVSRILC